MPASQDDFFCELTGRGLLMVEGKDAASFLHGQLTTNVHALANDQSALTAYADAQGRVLMLGRLHHQAGRFLLIMPHERIDPIRQQLARYVLRADVAIHDVSADWQQIGVAGEAVTARLQSQVTALPTTAGASVRAPDGAHIIRAEGPRPRWLLLGNHEQLATLRDQLGAPDMTGRESDWHQLNMMAGLPAVYTATAGHFVAQMLNLDHLDAIDFNKGCFPGQEVIARAHYRGRVKRRMHLFWSGPTGPLPQPGERLEGTNGHSGEVVDAVTDMNNDRLILAVVPTTSDATFTINDEVLTPVQGSTTE